MKLSDTAANRHINADLIKACAIFGVVYIHSNCIAGGHRATDHFLSDIFLFAVPAFIVVWSFFTEKTLLKRDIAFLDFSVPRFTRLLVPFLFWTAFYIALVPNFWEMPATRLISQHGLGYGWPGQYYFLILFQLVVLFKPLRLIYDRPVLRWLVLAAAVAACITYQFWEPPSPFDLLRRRFFFFWIPCTFLGIYWARGGTLGKLPFGATLAVLVIPFETWLIGDMIDPAVAYERLGIQIGAAIAVGAVLTRNDSPLRLSLGIQKLVALVGGSTMGIFVMNPAVIRLLQWGAAAVGYSTPDNIGATLVLSLTATTIIVGICLILTLALRRIGLARLVT